MAFCSGGVASLRQVSSGRVRADWAGTWPAAVVLLSACSVYRPELIESLGQAGGEAGITSGQDSGTDSGVATDSGSRTDRGPGLDGGHRPDSGVQVDTGAGTDVGDAVDSGQVDAGGCVVNPDNDGSCPLICPEVCDDIDNDCNGEVDDNVDGLFQECGTDTGECQTGHTECVGGVVACVDEVRPAAEKCDGLDNNCDGTADEDFPDADGDGIANCVDADYDAGLVDAGFVDAGVVDTGVVDAGVVQPLDRKKITVRAAYVDEALTDFPVLVNISQDGDLTAARADGRDLYFTADDGGTVLDSETEYWQPSTGALVAWVRLPSVSSSADTVFYLYYGDQADHSSELSPQGVWDAEFEGVWHLSSDADSSRYSRDGINNGTTDVAGTIAGARSFDGSSHMYIGQGLLPDEQVYTITAWVRPDLSTGEDYFGVVVNSTIAEPYEGSTLYLRRGDGALGAWEWGTSTADSWRFSSAHLATSGSWAFVAVTTDKAVSGSISSSINGQAWSQFHTDDTTDGLPNTAAGHLNIGRFQGLEAYGVFYYFVGEIDEVRISSCPRSSAWIKAAYENQKRDSSFLTIEAG